MKGRSSWWDVELFRIANGRLPSKMTDVVDRNTAKKVLDIAHSEITGYTQKEVEDAKNAMPYAFHLYGLLGCDGGKDCPNHENHEKGLPNP